MNEGEDIRQNGESGEGYDEMPDSQPFLDLLKEIRGPVTHKEKELAEKGYTRAAGQVFMQSELGDHRAARGMEVAASLTEANFADSVAKRVWDSMPQENQSGALADFQCTACLLRETQGITQEQMEGMTRKQLDAALQKAMDAVRAKDGSSKQMSRGITQLEDILISFGPTQAPGAMQGMNTIQISGTCEKCGVSITRTMQGEGMQLLGAMGGLMRLAEGTSRKPQRNDPCPCGSGKKYKRCCGKEY